MWAVFFTSIIALYMLMNQWNACCFAFITNFKRPHFFRICWTPLFTFNYMSLPVAGYWYEKGETRAKGKGYVMDIMNTARDCLVDVITFWYLNSHILCWQICEEPEKGIYFMKLDETNVTTQKVRDYAFNPFSNFLVFHRPVWHRVHTVSS